ncbi:MAG: NAD(+) synthase [Patescibacteria group bacterium]
MIKDIDGLIKDVCKQIREQCDVAVIGLSGGADSTLVAILCKEALGADNVIGVHLPYGDTDLKTFNSRSQKLSSHLGIRSEFIPIGAAVDSLKDTIETRTVLETIEPLSQLNAGNMRSRMRMIVLYAICCKEAEATGKRVRVVGTDNLSENFISFFTKFGDGGVDFNPIATIYKSEVYQLLDYFRDNKVIDNDMVDRIPSAGLWNNQTDEGELGYTYFEMEESIRRCMAGTQDITNNPVDKFVWERHMTGLHKNKTPPVFELRSYCD